MPPLPASETIYFDSMPDHFDTGVLRTATAVAFRRLDVDAKLVSAFQPDTRYRFHFKNGQMLRVR